MNNEICFVINRGKGTGGWSAEGDGREWGLVRIMPVFQCCVCDLRSNILQDPLYVEIIINNYSVREVINYII